ncbi:MAG: glyoxalase superfamily protein [Caldilineaceae bacterium]
MVIPHWQTTNINSGRGGHGLPRMTDTVLNGGEKMMKLKMKLELVAVPVSNTDRAKAFYTEKIGFHADHDHKVQERLRFVQLTPPGSACSIVIGEGTTEMKPGTQKGLQMVIEDAVAARKELMARGVEVSEVDVQPWGSFVYFSDPDGNRWALQQMPDQSKQQ